MPDDATLLPAPRDARFPAGRVAALAFGAVVAAAAALWFKSIAEEQSLDDRTRDRLRPRPHAAPSASDIRIG